MHVTHPLLLDLEECNPKIILYLNRIRAKKQESKKKMTKEQTPPKQLK